MRDIIVYGKLERREKGFRVSDPGPKAAVTAAVFAVALVSVFVGYVCPFRALTGVSCLGCGMTHAVRELLAGDLSAAVAQHGMVWTLPVLWLYFCADFRLLKDRRCNAGALAAILIGWIADYCLRTFL